MHDTNINRQQTDYEAVLDIFYSEIRNHYELPDDMLLRWFDTARAEFELDIKKLQYNSITQMFTPSSPVINMTLGLFMCKSYLRRELSRINKLNSIVGRDLQLTSTAATKQAVKAEYDTLLAEIDEKLHKQ